MISVFIERDSLTECDREGLSKAAVNLPIYDQRVDHLTAVMDRDITLDFH